METEYSSILQRGIYVEEKHYEQRGIVVFDDNELDTKHVDYDKLLSHLIENITKALNISSQNKVPGTFALFIHLNPKRKNSINKRSLLNIITVLNSLYKKNLHKCVFYNTNKYFRMIYGTIRPILDTSLKKKFLFIKTNDNELKNSDIDI